MAEPTTNRTPMKTKEVFSLLYLAQHNDLARPDYERFCGVLAEDHIPWDFEDNRFLEKIEELKSALATRLNIDSPEGVRAIAEETCSQTLSPEELERMEQGLEKTRRQKNEHKEQIFRYAKSRVDEYVQKLKAQNAPLTEEQEQSLRLSVARAAEQAADVGDTAGLQKTISSLTSVSTEVPEEIQAAISNTAKLSKITETTLTGGDEIHKGLLIEQCLSNPDVSPEIIANKFQGLQEAKILSLSDGMRTQIETELDSTMLDGSTMRQAAFRQAAASAGQGVSRPIDDVIKAVGGPQGKEFISDVIDTIIGSSIKESKESGGSIGGIKITPTAWTNPLTKEKIQKLEQSVAQRDKVRESTRAISTGFFQKGTTPAAATATAPTAAPNKILVAAANLWAPSIREGLRVYLETATFKVSINAPTYFHYFILAGTDVWNTILGRSTKAVAREAAKKAAGALLKTGGEKAATAVGLTAVKSFIGGIFGGPLGTFLALAGDKVVSFVWGGIKGLFSFFGEIAKGIIGGFGAPREKKPWWTDMSWMLPIACIAGIFILSGFTKINEDATTAAIVAEREGTSGDAAQYTDRGAPHGDSDPEWDALVEREKNIPRKKQNPVDFCTNNPTIEWCKPSNCPTCACPVVSSTGSTPYITQGPGGSWSHANSNAIDIGLPMQSRIRSPVTGVVTESTNKYEDGSGFAGSSDGGGYGNHIVITTPEGNTLVVAHLAYGSMPAKGTTITVGQQIGRIGQTGNSTGPHLHIGFTNKGAPSIGSLFPTKTPIPTNCASASQCGYLDACGAKPR